MRPGMVIFPALIVLAPIAARAVPWFRGLCSVTEHGFGRVFPVLAVLRADRFYGPAGCSAILAGIVFGLYLLIHCGRIVPKNMKSLNYSLVRMTLASNPVLRRNPSAAPIRRHIAVALTGVILFTIVYLCLLLNDIDGYIRWSAAPDPHWYAIRPNPFLFGSILSGQGIVESLIYRPLGAPHHLFDAITSGFRIAVFLGCLGMIASFLLVFLFNARAVWRNTRSDLVPPRARLHVSG